MNKTKKYKKIYKFQKNIDKCIYFLYTKNNSTCIYIYIAKFLNGGELLKEKGGICNYLSFIILQSEGLKP